jgi:hypothetical protein
MKQLELWAEKVGAQKLTRNFRRAPKTPNSRVGWLHRWQNIYTGETCEQTISELSQSKGISRMALVDVSCQGSLFFHRQMVGPRLRRIIHDQTKGWAHDRKLHEVIQGDMIDWLTVRQVKGGSKAIQFKASMGKAWDNIIVMMARYHQGSGCKTIAKEFGTSSGQVLHALKEAGIDTTKRRNYFKPSDSLTPSETRKARWRENMEIPSARLRKTVMNRIWSAMKSQRVNGVGSFSLVGCPVGFLRSYIEGKFERGMTWENYGEWHVDHIRPCASFDLSDKEQVLQCFNWRNLQPMWASENISKGSNYAKT